MEQELKTLTPSTRLVLITLRQFKVARLCQIIESTGLSKRSVLYSVKKLSAMGLIEINICLSDTRQRFYCIKINE
ncbi:MAG: winged helix DNA-binding protein [Ferroplasma sp.]|uniref:winged helix DNA-binding protein n=1 Tax=Ferroplasma sp. TaxID=2591003 RepID=UPI0028166448|nr:winged helix DNA-binding protein [Ferroplasma sp.]WMT51585.1 MAG: winged helix DNA-binding protein [Ferroplasma sp.]